nr:outer membrane beta-barrel protein [uncultured Psychroserpens sp.]
MKNNQDIGSALKGKLEGLQNSPDDFVWDAIEEKLKKKKRRLLFWYFTFGLGTIVLALILFNPFSIFNDNDLKSLDQNIEIVEQEHNSKKSSVINFEDKNATKESNTILNTNNQSPDDTVSTTIDSLILNKKSAPNTRRSNNTLDNVATSEKQKRTNTLLNQNKSNPSSQSIGLPANATNINDLKSLEKATYIEEKRKVTERLKEKASDSLLKIEDVAVTISEEEEIEDLLDKNKKIKDSVTERIIRWSIHPQLIQSNYGAFKADTRDNTSTNYGLLLGVRMTNKTFLRFGVRKLDLMQTVNNVSNNVSYLEFPLEVKYFLRDKKFNPYITGGVSYFMLEEQSFQNPVNIEYSDNFSLNFGLGLEHKLFNRFYINIESKFNYQIEPITSNIDYTPYILSISTGIDYRF